MAKTRTQKNNLIQEYKEDLNNSKAVYFVQPKGVSAVETTKLKLSLSKVKGKYKTVKNTLFTRAFKEVYPEIEINISEGEHAVVFTSDDVSSSAKEIKEFGKTTKKMEVVSGILDKKLLSKKEILEIADLPSYEEMLAKVVGVFNAPITSFVRTNNSVIQKFVLTLKAISEKTN